MGCKRTEVLNALAARLNTIQAANGYTLSVKKVYYDDIPLGIELADHEVPAILLLDKECRLDHAFSDLSAQWFFELQLIHGQVPDSTMLDFTRQVCKAIFANSPNAENNAGIRIHPLVYDIHLLGAFGDLHTIDANRFAILEIVLFCSFKPWDF